MMKKLLSFGLAFFLAGIISYGVGESSITFAQTASDATFESGNYLIDQDDNPSVLKGATSRWSDTNDIREVIRKIIDFILVFLGIIATAFVIYGGFLYITSRGDDGKTEEAKKIMTYAAIGIVIILVSFALVNSIIQIGTDDGTNIQNLDDGQNPGSASS